jgi:hypothetical protein
LQVPGKSMAAQSTMVIDYLTLSDRELLADCRVHTYRASGPGGQKRNKTDSAVRLHHQPSGLIVVGTESRSQHENKARALRRLRQAIALNCRTKIEAEVFTPPAVVESCRTRQGRLEVGPRDHRFWLVAGTLLDALASAEGSVREASRLLGITSANLVKLLRSHPKLWAKANELRRAYGRSPLK